MSGVRLIQVPYHLGRKRRGPRRRAGSARTRNRRRQRRGREAGRVPERDQGDLRRRRRLGGHVVRETVDESLSARPGRRCSSALGAVTGLDRDVGVVWFDAHGDFHTPDSTPTGFSGRDDSRPAHGRGVERAAASFCTVPPERVVLVGTRLRTDREERLTRCRSRGRGHGLTRCGTRCSRRAHRRGLRAHRPTSSIRPRDEQAAGPWAEG